MKRNINLQPLSRQHHNGLLAVLLLEKGIAKNADPAVMARFIDHLFETDLNRHFLLEEMHLLPLLRQYNALEKHASVIEAEHKQLNILKAQLLQNPQAENINAFAALLEKHIRFEERSVFAGAEQHIPAEKLDELGLVLQHHDDKNCMGYPDKFWE